MKLKTRGHLPPQKDDEIKCAFCGSVWVVEDTDHFKEIEGYWLTYCPSPPVGCGHMFLVDDDVERHTYRTIPPHIPDICQFGGCGKMLHPLTTGQHIVRYAERDMMVCSACRSLLENVGGVYQSSAKEVSTPVDPGTDASVTNPDFPDTPHLR
jgi:hypothetical protein